MTKMKILISGANGQLGHELKLVLTLLESYECIFLEKKDWDITNHEQSIQLFEFHHPHIVINCAAYTAVDKAETETSIAYDINANSLIYLTSLCKNYDTLLIHFSTDYVFHADTINAFSESHPKSPLSVYALSKSKGEDIIISSDCNYLIFRSSWIYSQFGHNFVKTILRLTKTKSELSVVNDQVGCPTHAASIAQFLFHLLDTYSLTHLEHCKGIYHYTDLGKTTWFEFAKAILEYQNIHIKLTPITTEQFNAQAARPPFSLLDTTKLRNTFHYNPEHWIVELHKCLKLLRDEPHS